MQTLRRLRKLIALVALIWLPMTVFAQVCATQCSVASMHAGGVLSRVAQVAQVTQVTQATQGASAMHATSFVSADSDDHACDMSAVCAFAALVPLTSVPCDSSVSVAQDSMATTVSEFASFRPIADTPPPRALL